MSFLSSGGGDDRLQVGMAVFAVVMSLAVTMMLPVVAPAYDADTGYTYADIYNQKASLEAFTGESMTNMTPWKLTGVYTPWVLGDSMDNIDPETGWAYGESVAYSEIGKTTNIKLSKDHISDRPLYYNEYKNVQWEVEENIWWMYNLSNGENLNVIGQIVDFFGGSTTETVTKIADVNSWQFSGYRYEFDPMLKIDYTDPAGSDYQNVSQSDAKLSLVWYKGQYGSGISGGLILYSNTTNGFVSNILLDDILAGYDLTTTYSSRFGFDFEGVKVYLNFRFDLDVISGSEDLAQAFDDGRWTIAITALSMDNFMDISSSNSLSNSAASIIDTYIQIYTMSFPNLDFLWSMVLWIICILPIQLTVLMFLARFGVVGVGLGVLGSAVLAGLGLGA